MEKSVNTQQQRPSTSVIRSATPAEEDLLIGAALTTPRLGDLPSNEAQELLHSLLQENRALRKENTDLYSLREALLRQQEAVTKQNERLIKQIEGKLNRRTPRAPMALLAVNEPTKNEGSSRGGSVSARNSPLPPLKRSNSLISIPGQSSLVNPLSQSITLLDQQSTVMGLNGTCILPMTVSKEMTKRGFSASKSAENKISDDNGDSLNLDPAMLSPPQVYGHRKKLTDLKIDMNFVPKKNKMKRSSSIGVGSHLPSPDGKGKTFSQQPRIRVANSSITNGAAAGSSFSRSRLCRVVLTS